MCVCVYTYYNYFLVNVRLHKAFCQVLNKDKKFVFQGMYNGDFRHNTNFTLTVVSALATRQNLLPH